MRLLMSASVSRAGTQEDVLISTQRTSVFAQRAGRVQIVTWILMSAVAVPASMVLTALSHDATICTPPMKT